MRNLLLLFTIVILYCFNPASEPLLSRPAASRYQPKFRDLVASDGLIADPQFNQAMKIGWVRLQVAWSEISPSKGTLLWDKTDGLVNAAHAQSIEVLPDLTYTPIWATTTPELPHSLWQFYPPKNPSDWTDFVEAAVSRYMAAPYNLKYFQVWNEPTQGTFWRGATNQQWVDEIYIPAAKIIRAHGANVVFGGWPNDMSAYSTELQYHNAWQWTDILDIHYYPLSAIQTLYAQWIATGKCKGIWETEVGNSDNPALVTGLYSTVFNWATTAGHWTFPEQYKLFWFIGYGVNCKLCLTTQTARTEPLVLTRNGQALQALAQKLP